MKFIKTDRLDLKFIGNSFGNACKFSLQPNSSNYILHAELIVVTDSPLQTNIELKVYDQAHIIPPSEEQYHKHFSRYVRTINVTPLVPYNGATTFVVDFPNHSDEYTSKRNPIWGLIIIYGDSNFPVRHISLFINEQQDLFTFSPLLLPSIGPNHGILYLFGEMKQRSSSIPCIAFGPSMKQEASTYPLTRTINNTNNLFRPILNEEVDISSTLLSGQTSAILHIPSEQMDSINLFAVGLQVNAPEPKMTIVHSADKEHALVGDIVTYTTSIINDGTTTAECIQFRTGFPDGTILISDSVTVNTIPVTANPSEGLLLGNLPINDTITIAYKIKIVHKPSRSLILHQPVLDYQFTPIENTIRVGNQPSNISNVYIHS
ncbi:MULTISPECIES: DUF11 domain-containing protein [Bacillus cereus group]|uniref:DUF11 domain-containing protein n=1 Tax=Bacillus thuringiensis TaxID=1428 RepID=A0AB33B734_BACTU|nr:DUF11 domain-containing protein [Bacillus thuringiensis]AJG79532.1 hypothetical protein BF38_5564 [Bacillus thuringiensis]EEM74043.1 hypothetical protein bthur0010_59730 [Bacillus thuringiensis serovar pondicheriensis BGSC 4BA1]